ncbi:N-acetylmuramoyl-L-alanine amidase [uncultured Phascolarctobacterium sp.]|uniref:N-acetylmuramoyl-L-alanine amidase n=1 Tax=uncultured Phascolarctobacterium sp. TaxID=512296 RepID=UPI0026277B0A|nr:N-acetylmuramoyl-L-alanine amidase [uncultured Phascolarctobacterium sp.]
MLIIEPKLLTLRELHNLAAAAKGKINRLYLHWTAGRYGQFFDDYHVNIDADGEFYQTCQSLDEKKAHTWRRNTGSAGLALCCALGAQCGADGVPVYPQGFAPTWEQIDRLAMMVAILCIVLEIPLDAEHVLTHCEAAMQDGYGIGSGDSDLRWDLSYLPDKSGRLRPGGELLREIAHGYIARLRKLNFA